MIQFKTIAAICLGVTLCAAQTINISGVVQDSGGVGLVGAMVKLEKANLTATSGAGGVFTLRSATSAKARSLFDVKARNRVEFRSGRITFSLSSNTAVGISIHDVGGRQVFDSKRTLGSGTHSINVPPQANGVYLCRITIGHESYSLKTSSFGAFSSERAVVSSEPSTLAKQAKARAVISDVIAATKTGWLDYRCVIGNSDTSGVIIKMLANAGDVTDADGNVYQSVRIGNQVWTVENLRTTKYNDGTDIAHVTNSATWNSLSTPGYCFYNNSTDAAEQEKWGALYNWYAVSTGKLAPAGWHVPTDAEWGTLQNYLIANGYNWDGTTTGNKIAKSMVAQTDWTSYTQSGTPGNDLSKNNASGLSALPGGLRGLDGRFLYQSIYGYWWSAAEGDASPAWGRRIYYRIAPLYRNYYGRSWGFSVRLLRD